MKNKQKLIFVGGVILAVGVGLVVFNFFQSAFFENQEKGDFSFDKGSRRELIGGEKDEHGCLVAAGYSWCESKKKCLRSWEEDCDDGFNDDENKKGCVDKCGDGFCQEVVCQALDCPCAETKEGCPQDCN